MTTFAPESPGVAFAGADAAAGGLRVWRGLRSGWRTRASMIVLALFAAAALWGEIVYRLAQARDRTPSYAQLNLDARYLPPSLFRHPFAAAAGAEADAPQVGARLYAGLRELARHPFGTDNLGRDYLARTMVGMRISLVVGVTAVAFQIIIGIAVGGVVTVPPTRADIGGSMREVYEPLR